MGYLSTNFQNIAEGAAIGALAGASFGPVGCGTGTAIGAIIGLLEAQVSYLSTKAGLTHPVWKITQAVLDVFALIGITKAIACVTFKASCIFTGISIGYLAAFMLVASIATAIFSAIKKQQPTNTDIPAYL